MPEKPAEKPPAAEAVETRRDWEVVQEDTTGASASRTDRLRIQQGWLYRVTHTQSGSTAVVFVPAILGG